MIPTRIRLAETDADIARCFPVMAQLRPHLIEAEFVSRVRTQQKENFHLAFATDEKDTVRSVSGFRILNMLVSGKTCYVDDLITDGTHRSKGYGDQLLDWLVARARELGCDHFSLDSGTQRVDAHRFYLRKRMVISAFHFQLPLRR